MLTFYLNCIIFFACLFLSFFYSWEQENAKSIYNHIYFCNIFSTTKYLKKKRYEHTSKNY